MGGEDAQQRGEIDARARESNNQPRAVDRDYFNHCPLGCARPGERRIAHLNETVTILNCTSAAERATPVSGNHALLEGGVIQPQRFLRSLHPEFSNNRVPLFPKRRWNLPPLPPLPPP